MEPQVLVTIESNLSLWLSQSHLRTTNPIESTFATVRLRTHRTKGSGSRVATLTMVFKLGMDAQKLWVDRVSNPEPTPNSEILREQAHPLAKYFGVRGMLYRLSL